MDELHSIENTEDGVAKILLTSLIGGVKTHSFFDKFPGSSRLASLSQRPSDEASGEFGTSSEATAGAHGARQRSQTSRWQSKRERRRVRGKTESRDVERFFRLIASPAIPEQRDDTQVTASELNQGSRRDPSIRKSRSNDDLGILRLRQAGHVSPRKFSNSRPLSCGEFSSANIIVHP